MTEKKAKFFYQGACVSAGAVVRLLVSLASVPLLLRWLGAERYGAWMVLNSVLSLSMVLEFGLSAALTSRLAESISSGDRSLRGRLLATSLTAVCALGLLAAVGLWVFSSYLGRLVGIDQALRGEAVAALQVLPLLVVPRFLQQWVTAVEAGVLRFDIQAAVETVGQVLLQISALVIAWFDGTVTDLMWLLLCWTVASLAAHGWLLQRAEVGWMGPARVSGNCLAALFRIGVPHTLSTTGSLLFSQADRLIVSAVLGPATAGVYAAATSICAKINELSALPLRVVPSMVGAALGTGDSVRARRLFILATRTCGWLAVTLASALILLTPYLATVLVRERTMQTTMAGLLSVLALIYGLYSLNASGFFAALGLCRTDINARWALSGAILSLVLLAILTPRFGVQGAALANAGYLLTLMINIQVAPLLGTSARESATLLMKYAATLAAFWVALFIVRILALPAWAEATGALTLGLLGIASWWGVAQQKLQASGPFTAFRLLCVRAARELS